jgi:DNA polymerase-3 subunit delta'
VTLYRDVLLVQSGSVDNLINQDIKDEITKVANSTTESKTLVKIQAILRARVNLTNSSATLLTMEALMLELKD